MDKDIVAAIILVLLIIFRDFFKNRNGKNNATKLELENNKLTRQTSEAVTRCADKTNGVIASNIEVLGEIKRLLEKNEFGHLHDRQLKTLQMLEKMGEHQNICLSTLDRMGGLIRSIADDIQQTNSSVVHERIEGKLHSMEEMLRDVKYKLNK